MDACTNREREQAGGLAAFDGPGHTPPQWVAGMPNPPSFMAGYTSAALSAACHVAVIPRRHVWRGTIYLSLHTWWRGQTV